MRVFQLRFHGHPKSLVLTTEDTGHGLQRPRRWQGKRLIFLAWRWEQRIWAGRGARLAVTFHPPGRYGYDEDGLMSRCKAIFDGIADAIGVNDRNFRYPEPTIAEPVKGGKVIIALSPAEKR